MNDIGRRRLGDSDVYTSDIGVGTNSWGTEPFENVYQAFTTFLDAGINFFDTAPVYGKSESVLGECRKKDGRPIIISTKFTPSLLPWGKKRGPKDLFKSLDESLLRLGVEQIDLYTLHFPPSLILLDEYMDSLTKAVRSGKIRAVGVSNFSEPLLRQAHAKLKYNGIPLASIQSGFNLLHRNPEQNGVLKACQELNVSFICHGPLAQGVLSGKYRSGEKKQSFVQKTLVKLFSNVDFSGEMKGVERGKPHSLKREKLEPLFKVLEEVGKDHGKSITQVAVNWLLSTDPCVVPIPGAKNARQAVENIGIAGWRLTKDEYQRISQAEIDSR